MKPRPDWDEYFLAIAMIVATRSTCRRRKVGAVFTRDNRILATGYNGSPTGTQHCTDIGCIREQLQIPSGKQHELCRGSHAEMNAIAQAASSGVSLQDCKLYCINEPCSICTKLLIQSGCKHIIVMHTYDDELATALRNEAGIRIDKFQDHDKVFDTCAVGGLK